MSSRVLYVTIALKDADSREAFHEFYHQTCLPEFLKAVPQFKSVHHYEPVLEFVNPFGLQPEFLTIFEIEGDDDIAALNKSIAGLAGKEFSNQFSKWQEEGFQVFGRRFCDYLRVDEEPLSWGEDIYIKQWEWFGPAEVEKARALMSEAMKELATKATVFFVVERPELGFVLCQDKPEGRDDATYGLPGSTAEDLVFTGVERYKRIYKKEAKQAAGDSA